MSKISSKGMAELLRTLRTESGISISRLARLSGLQESTIIRLETDGVHGFDVLNAVLDALDLDVHIYISNKEKADTERLKGEI